MKKFITYTYLATLFIGLLSACKANTSQDSPADTSSLYTSEIPQDFIQFINKFGRDSSFQMAHIQFPLKGISSTDPSYAYTWQKEDWVLHRPFNDHNGSFQQSYKNLNGIIIETTTAPGTSFSMERRFIPDGKSSYSLIYYDEMRDLTQSFN